MKPPELDGPEFNGKAVPQRRGRVLFVCHGNSCRSQMAEAFARHHVGHLIDAYSAGVLPSGRVSGRARATMAECGVPLSPTAVPKSVSAFDLNSFDLIVNLCEYALPKTTTPILRIQTPDARPAGEDVLREVRNEIESRVIGIGSMFRPARIFRPILFCGEPALGNAPQAMHA